MLLATNKVNNNSKTYTKQISTYNGIVYAEIIYQDEDTDYKKGSNFWYCSAHKNFSGGMFNRDAREIDWINAHKWADSQLALMDKYGTKKECKSNNIYESERLEFNEKTDRDKKML